MKPILFNGDMVRAILDGRKTVTRRPVKPRRNKRCRLQIFNNIIKTAIGWFGVDFDERPFINDEIEQPFSVGDILYARETWFEHKGKYYYRADGFHKNLDAMLGKPFFKFKPSIHMPREAARIFLRVTGVRAERLQEIGLGGCYAEGCPEEAQERPLVWFRMLWDSIYSAKGYGWEQNPWLWVIEFERVDP